MIQLHSGFSSGKYEQFYDRLVFKLVQLLQKQIVKNATTPIPHCHDFARKILKIHKALKKLEVNRQTNLKESNVSNAFNELQFSLRDLSNSRYELSSNSTGLRGEIDSKRSKIDSEISQITNTSVFSNIQNFKKGKDLQDEEILDMLFNDSKELDKLSGNTSPHTSKEASR